MKFLLMVLTTLILLGATEPIADHTPTRTTAPIKSPNDKREYAYFTLPNGLRVLLISDPLTDKAAAALAIGIGSTSNPPDRPGLAHFLEHMLFMGTKKYPDVDAYSRFITKHGGITNAGTGGDVTNYIFSVDPDKLDPALDRFAQFFIAPLFDPKYVEREAHAVDSEYQLKRKSDGRRLGAAIKRAYNPLSPYSYFTVGSLQTLADRQEESIHDALLKFYRTHYSADQMGLVVLGRQDLPQLKKMVLEKFASIPQKEVKRFEPDEKELALPPDRLPARLNVVPLNDTHRLILIYPVPSAKKFFKVSPLYYIATLLQSHSRGSLYTLLRRKGWITELSAGGESLNDKEGQFHVTMELTAEGIRHIPQIESALYGYIDLIKKRGVEKWRYEEQQKLDELSFRYAVKESPFEYVSFLSSRILDYPPSELIRGGRILQQYDGALIHRYLGYLRADNALTVVLDKNLETDETEAHYQVPYSLRKGIETFPDPHTFAGELKLPGPNPFVPKNPVLIKSREKRAIPVILEKDKGFTLWHKLDNSFGTPRAVFTLRYRSPVAMDSALHSVTLKLFLRIVQERLATVSDAASRAGIGYSLKPEAKGFTLQAYGYSETLPLFLDKLFTALSDHFFNAQRFTIQKDQLDRILANMRREYAYAQVLGALFRSVAKPSWSPEEQRDALHPLKRDDLTAWVGRFFAAGEVTMLSLGNFDYKASLQLASRLKTTLIDKTVLQPVKGPDLSLPEPDQTRKVKYQVAHPDSVLIEADADHKTDAESSARWQLLAQLIGQPFTAELRTRQQLGYVVLSQFVDFYRYPMLLLIVQSSRVGVDELLIRFKKFHETFFERMQKIDAKSFEANKVSLINTLLRKDETLLQRNERYWSDIVNDRLDFNFRQKVAAKVKKLDKKSMLDFYKKRMLDHPARVYGSSQGTP